MLEAIDISGHHATTKIDDLLDKGCNQRRLGPGESYGLDVVNTTLNFFLRGVWLGFLWAWGCSSFSMFILTKGALSDSSDVAIGSPSAEDRPEPCRHCHGGCA